MLGNTCKSCSHGWFKTTQEHPECNCGCHVTFDRVLKLSGDSKSVASQKMMDIMQEHAVLERNDPELMSVFDDIVQKCHNDISYANHLSLTEMYIIKQVADKSKALGSSGWKIEYDNEY